MISICTNHTLYFTALLRRKRSDWHSIVLASDGGGQSVTDQQLLPIRKAHSPKRPDATITNQLLLSQHILSCTWCNPGHVIVLCQCC